MKFSLPVILTINSRFWNGHARQLNLNSVLLSSYFLTSFGKIVYGEGKCTLLGGWVKHKIVINQGFLARQIFWYFYRQNIFSCFVCEKEVTVLRSTEERVARTSCLSVKREAPPRLPPTEGRPGASENSMRSIMANNALPGASVKLNEIDNGTQCSARGERKTE